MVWYTTALMGAGAASLALLAYSSFKVFRILRADADLKTYGARRKPDFWRGKVVLITGASSGIGEALAHTLAPYGAKLVLASRRVQKLEEVKAALNTDAANVKVVQLDVEKLDEIPARMEAAIASFGRIDVLVNNAGISTRALATEVSFEVVQRLARIDYLGQVAVTNAVLPGMLERKQGHIVNVSSVAGKFGWTLRSAYSGAKFALIGFMQSLRMETEHLGIKVTNVCPGPVDTAVSENALLASGKRFGVTLHGNGATKETKLKGVMTAARCGDLLANAVSAGVEQSWIATQPTLMMMYLTQYAPSIARNMLRKHAKKSIDDFRREASKVE